MPSKFNSLLVQKISKHLQDYMKSNNLDFLTADESASLLAKSALLTNTIGPKPGFLFRQLFRDGRDKKLSQLKELIKHDLIQNGLFIGSKIAVNKQF